MNYGSIDTYTHIYFYVCITLVSPTFIIPVVIGYYNQESIYVSTSQGATNDQLLMLGMVIQPLI